MAGYKKRRKLPKKIKVAPKRNIIVRIIKDNPVMIVAFQFAVILGLLIGLLYERAKAAKLSQVLLEFGDILDTTIINVPPQLTSSINQLNGILEQYPALRAPAESILRNMYSTLNRVNSLNQAYSVALANVEAGRLTSIKRQELVSNLLKFYSILLATVDSIEQAKVQGQNIDAYKPLLQNINSLFESISNPEFTNLVASYYFLAILNTLENEDLKAWAAQSKKQVIPVVNTAFTPTGEAIVVNDYIEGLKEAFSTALMTNSTLNIGAAALLQKVKNLLS